MAANNKGRGGANLQATGKGGLNGDQGFFENTPLTRKRDLIMVHKDELEEIRSFDISTVTHGGLGGFFCSTAISLAVDEYFRLEKFIWNQKMQFCVLAFVAGALLCYVGFRDWKRKHNKLTKIIDQTKPSGPTTYEHVR